MPINESDTNKLRHTFQYILLTKHRVLSSYTEICAGVLIALLTIELISLTIMKSELEKNVKNNPSPLNSVNLKKRKRMATYL